jgi:flagellar motor switch protein FliN/FliY
MSESAKAENTSKEENAQDKKPSLADEKYDMDLILDIPLEVSVELGKVKMIVNDLLQLGQGSIIELGKPVGESLEIFVNHKLIAKGEVVVVDEKLGVRVTDIISPVERVKSLG